MVGIIIMIVIMMTLSSCCVAGELLTVAPWAVKTMPGLFTLNERVLLLGKWEHGFFSFAAVGALIVGSVSLTIDEVRDVIIL